MIGEGQEVGEVGVTAPELLHVELAIGSGQGASEVVLEPRLVESFIRPNFDEHLVHESRRYRVSQVSGFRLQAPGNSPPL